MMNHKGEITVPRLRLLSYSFKLQRKKTLKRIGEGETLKSF